MVQISFICDVYSPQKQIAFFLLFIAVLLLIILPDAFRYGMFMDGMQYACVSRNLYSGEGSFWFPFLSESWSRKGVHSFLEHPPLFYYLQSKFFVLLGDRYLTEKIYDLFVMLLSLFFIHKIWLVLSHNLTRIKGLSWLPMLLWIICPTVSWVFRNNLIESTLSVFVLGSVYFGLKALTDNKAKTLFNLILSASFIFFGSLTKGLPGIFPLTMVFCYWLSTRKISFKTTLLYTSLLTLMPLSIYLLLYFFDTGARESLGFYLENRLLERVQFDPTVDNRFSILLWFVLDFAISLAISLLIFLLLCIKSIQAGINKHTLSFVLFFVLTGSCGLIPLCLTRVQRSMYYVPALALFALALGLLLAPALNSLLNLMNEKWIRVLKWISFSVILITTGYSLSIAGDDCRDHEMLEDVRRIGRQTGSNVTVLVPFELYTKWNFQFYLLRYYKITLSPEENVKSNFRLLDKNSGLDFIPGYKPVNADLQHYALFLSDSAFVEADKMRPAKN